MTTTTELTHVEWLARFYEYVRRNSSNPTFRFTYSEIRDYARRDANPEQEAHRLLHMFHQGTTP